MKVCGFSFVKNGMQFDYPFRQALLSILPICDTVIVAVGQSTDDTLEVVKAIHPKIQVIETVWDESLKLGGRVFASETDKAFQAIAQNYDWAFYIQGDEVVHEKYLPNIQKAMADNLHDARVDGLLFKYLHFFGSYDYVGAKYSWYRREIRIVRNRKDIYSYRDAQGFRKGNNEKLRVKLIDAYIHHYGWVRHPAALQQKIESNVQLYSEVDNPAARPAKEYNYNEAQEPVKKFTGTHPQVMLERIAHKNWHFLPGQTPQYASAKDRLKRSIAALTGWMPGEYKNYKLIK